MPLWIMLFVAGCIVGGLGWLISEIVFERKWSTSWLGMSLITVGGLIVASSFLVMFFIDLKK